VPGIRSYVKEAQPNDEGVSISINMWLETWGDERKVQCRILNFKYDTGVQEAAAFTMIEIRKRAWQLLNAIAKLRETSYRVRLSSLLRVLTYSSPLKDI
jgi:hypothetical protein